MGKEKRTRVFLVDTSADVLDQLKQALEAGGAIEVVGAAVRGDSAYVQISLLRPDILMTELLLPGLDGLSLLRRLKSDGRLPRTLVISGLVTDYIVRTVSGLGVDDFLSKPCELSTVCSRIEELAAPAYLYEEQNLRQAIARALVQLGITPNLYGHKYLSEAIYRAIEDRGVLHGITKILYPDLARRFQTTASCVERSMRSAICRAWERSTPESRRRYFGGLFDGYTSSPGNAKFILLMAQFLEDAVDYRLCQQWR